jgi:hypothetical protein
MLVGLVALTALGLCVWWTYRLSEVERQILGTWYSRLPPNTVWPGDTPGSGTLIVNDYAPDRTFRVHGIAVRTGAVRQRTDGQAWELRGRWGVRDGELIYTYERNLGLLDRARRLLPAGFPGAKPVGTDTRVIERLTADELIVRENFGNIVRMTRTRPK